MRLDFCFLARGKEWEPGEREPRFGRKRAGGGGGRKGINDHGSGYNIYQLSQDRASDVRSEIINELVIILLCQYLQLSFALQRQLFNPQPGIQFC